METLVFQGTVTALSSVAHGGDKKGITTLFNREKIQMPDGSIEEIALITGNSVRGTMRDVSMLHLLGFLGYDTHDGLKLDLETYYFLLSGGALDSKGKRGIDIDLAREWRELLPPIALLGSACGNQTLPGKLEVGKLYPICEETRHLLPENIVPEGKHINSIWDLMQREGYTRMDDAKDDRVRNLLAAPDRRQLEARVKGERDKARAGELRADKPGAKQQMRYFIETLCAGTDFFCEFVLHDPTDVEFDAFAVMVTEWQARSRLGGCAGKGLGRFALHFNKWIKLDPRQGLTGQEVDRPLGTRYIDHLRDNADTIRHRLDEKVHEQLQL